MSGRELTRQPVQIHARGGLGLSLWPRVVIVCGAGLLGVAISVTIQSADPSHQSDLFQTWAGARALMAGLDPYAVVGPGRLYEYPFVPPYPLPAFLVVLPLVALPLWLADLVFVGVSGAALAWVLTGDRLNDPRLLVFASFAFLLTAQVSQWSALLTAAIFLPALGPVLAAKPTIAAVLWLAYPSRWTLFGAAMMCALAFLIRPLWLADWWQVTRQLTHTVSPIALHGGPMLLAALTRWRQPEARLLVGLACVPQSTFLYEAVPLFLIPKRIEEAAFLAAMTVAVRIVWVSTATLDYASDAIWMGQLMVWLLYLPCLVMIFRRDNAAGRA